MGMVLDEITHKSCVAHVGVGDNWATIYFIISEQKRQGHAEELLTEAKKYYETQGKQFGSTVALNKGMETLLKKLKIKEYKTLETKESHAKNR